MTKTLVQPLAFSADALEASLCRDSLADFVKRFWPYACADTLKWSWHMDAICEALQEAAMRIFRGEPKKHDIVINVPPGTSKSMLCSVMFPAWCWTHMPSFRSICGSFSDDLAMDFSRKCRDIVVSEKWKQLFGDIELREDSKAKGHFITKQLGERKCVGTCGLITGRHAHAIIVDDPIDPSGVFSKPVLESVNRWMTETLPMRKVDKEVSITILIMQRLHQNDPSNLLLKKAEEGGAKVKHINLPAEIEGDGMSVVRPRKLAKFYKQGLLDPVRLKRSVLNEAKVALGITGYAGQMLQRPAPPGGSTFKVVRIKRDTPPRPIDFRMRVRYWDKAGTGGAGAYTVGLLMGVDKKGQFWLLHVVRGQWESNKREDIIFQTACVDTNAVIVGLEQEPGSGGKESAQSTLRRLSGFRVRVDRPVGDKEMRADPFSVQVNAGNVFMAPGEWNREYLDELEFFPRGQYKDQVDASSGAFSLLTQWKIKLGALFSVKRDAQNVTGARWRKK